MIDIKSIWASHIPSKETVIKTKIKEVSSFNCFAATNHITGHHLYIFQISNTSVIPDFNTNKFKGLAIEVLDFDSHKELTIILLDIQLKDIFCLFIENILQEIQNCVTENEALVKTSNVILRWKKLFDKINFNGLTIEHQKGLIGELLLFNEFLKENYPIEDLLQCWTGPDNQDKDYIFGSIGIEVKLTSSKYPTLKITNERQLDISNLAKLYLALYLVEEVKENGFSLYSLVEQTRKIIQSNHQALRQFNEKLILIGYLDDDAENYMKLYALKKTNIYVITTDFPKIAPSNLAVGIYNTSYHIELSACERYMITINSPLELFK